MKKALVVFILLMLVVPAMATITVTATCSGTGTARTVTLSYAIGTGDTLAPRAFGLSIACDANGTIGTVVPVKTSYYVAPGSFDAAGDVNWGSPIVPVTVGKSFILEVGSLYASNDPCVGHRTAPPTSGTLLSFPLTLSSSTVRCAITVAVDAARGGVVREDPTITGNVTLNGCVFNEIDCMKNPTVPAIWYTDWVFWNKPACWCYSRQCRGDFDGKKVGVLWVQTTDFNGLKSAINKTDTALALVPNGICADFDHLKVGVLRVQTNDFNIFKSYVNKVEAQVPICPMTNFNFWITPAP